MPQFFWFHQSTIVNTLVLEPCPSCKIWIRIEHTEESKIHFTNFILCDLTKYINIVTILSIHKSGTIALHTVHTVVKHCLLLRMTSVSTAAPKNANEACDCAAKLFALLYIDNTHNAYRFGTGSLHWGNSQMDITWVDWIWPLGHRIHQRLPILDC